MSNKDSDNDNQGKAGIRIVDRRRFDSAGEEKSENTVASKVDQKVETPKAETKNSMPEQDFTMSDSPSPDSEPQDEAQISFGSFVLSLATQALMQLGQLPAPDGVAIPVDPAAAQQTIDILAMLQAKTKGNLDSKEEGLLRDALHSLKVAFLRFR